MTCSGQISTVQRAHLEPVHAALARLVRRALALEHLDHEPLAARLDRLVEEDLDRFVRVRIARRRERKLADDGLEVGVQELAALLERALQQRLAVEVEQVEGEDVHLDGDVLGLNVLALAAAELLERQDALLLLVPRDGLGVKDERRRAGLDALPSQLGDGHLDAHAPSGRRDPGT